MNAKTEAASNMAATGGFNKSAGVTLTLAGEKLFAHASGVLLWPAQEILIVADLHLEKGSFYAARQIFLPPYDTMATLENLENAITAFKPKRVISLGDSFHDGAGPERLSHRDRLTLQRLVSMFDWLWIAGNHDQALPGHLGGMFLDEINLKPLTFRHEPTADAGMGEISGHLHPSARVRGHGRSVRSRCFVISTGRIILPAFGAYTGGLNVRDTAFDRLFPGGQYHAYMMGRDRLFPVASSSCLPG